MGSGRVWRWVVTPRCCGRFWTKRRRGLDKDLRDQPEVEAQLRTTIGQVYTDLGDYGKAIEMQRAALAIQQKLFGDGNLAMADTLTRLAEALIRQNHLGEHNLAEAEQMARRALTLRQKLLGDENPSVASSLSTLALVLYGEDKKSEAEILYRQALALERKLGNENGTATLLNNLSILLQDRERLAEAESTTRESLAIEQRTLGEENPTVASALRNLGQILRLEPIERTEIADQRHSP